MLIFSSKVMGFYYFLFSFLGSLLGFSFSLVISVELNSPFSVMGEFFYYVSLTSHGVIMVFYFLTMLGTGFFVYLIPEMCFVKDFYFFKLSFISLMLSFLSLLVLMFSLFTGEMVNTGWTLYFPLSSEVYNNFICLDIAVLGLMMFSISSMMSSVNVLCTIVFSFISFESVLDIPVFVWSALLTSFLMVLSTPSFICVLCMLLLDSNFNTYYFDYEFGGSAMLFQSLFWFWGHPEVYVLILPVFGLVSQCVYVMCGSYVYNKNGMIFSMFSLTMLSFLVWGHHMVTAGLDLDVKGFFMISTIVMSVPTGVKVFSWLYTLFVCSNDFSVLPCLLLMFMFTFSLGGVTGVFLSNYSLDIVFHDSYFVMGHFHTILAVSSLFGYLSGLLLLFGKSFSDTYFYLLSLLLSLISVSMFQLMFSFHVKGLLGVPSSVSNYVLDNYFLFYVGGVSFLGVWFSLLLILILFILYCCCNISYTHFNSTKFFINFFKFYKSNYYFSYNVADDFDISALSEKLEG